MSKIAQWFKRRFTELDLLEEYFPILFTRWQAALWGGSVLAVAFGWHFVTADWPYPVKVTACVMALFFAGYYVWRADHVRLQTAFAIKEVHPQTWTDQTNGKPARAYYLEVINKSETTSIQDVEVQLTKIEPTVENLEWLPVHLVHQHDRSASPEKTFALHPGKPKNINLVSAFENGSQFTVLHIVSGVTNQVVGRDRRRLQVTITGRDVPALSVWFDVYFDSEGFFVCEMEEKAHPPLNLTRRQRKAVTSSAKSALAPCRGPWHISPNAPGATCPKCGLAFPREGVTLDREGIK